MFIEKLRDIGSQNAVSTHLAEAEEAARQNEHDKNHPCDSEKYAQTP